MHVYLKNRVILRITTLSMNDISKIHNLKKITSFPFQHLPEMANFLYFILGIYKEWTGGYFFTFYKHIELHRFPDSMKNVRSQAFLEHCAALAKFWFGNSKKRFSYLKIIYFNATKLINYTSVIIFLRHGSPNTIQGRFFWPSIYIF